MPGYRRKRSYPKRRVFKRSFKKKKGVKAPKAKPSRIANKFKKGVELKSKERQSPVSASGQALWIPLYLNGTQQYPARKDLVIVPNVWEFMTQGTEAGQMLGQEIAAKWMTMKFLFDYTPMAAIAYPIELQLIYGFLRASKIYIYKYGCS